jgi:serine/threonine-protein kinase
MSRLDAELDDLTLRAQARVGQRIKEKWHLDALLGVGGMAAVYAATHRNGKRVAIKILHREVAMSDDSRARFTREGYVANAVGHKGAVSVIDDDVTEDGAPFLTMDLLDGETLDQRVRRKGRLGVEEVLAATYQLLDVLAAAHGKRIVHRDIKPENVFLTKDASVKVLDFGIAHLHEIAPSASASGSTQSGHTMGTPSFMPPEQARGRWEEVDPRSDVWAVGATMFTLLTGRHVHEADTMNEVLLGAMSIPAKSVALYRPELPPTVTAVVDRALEFAMEDRWQSAKEMQDAVREAYRSLKQSIEELGREPTLMASSVSTPNTGAVAAPLPPGKRAAMTTGRPTTHTAPDDTQAFLARASRRNKIGMAAGAVIGVLLAVALMFVKSAGPGEPAVAAAGATDPSSSATTTTPSAEAPPAAPPTGATMTVLPPRDVPAEVTPPPVPVAPSRLRPRKPAAVVTPSQPVVAPVTPAPPPAAPPPDPLTRRH